MIKTSMAWAYALAGMFHGPPAASAHVRRRAIGNAPQTVSSASASGAILLYRPGKLPQPKRVSN